MYPDKPISERNARLRRILAVASLVLILIGLAALSYVFWPLPVEQVQETLSPSLFIIP